MTAQTALTLLLAIPLGAAPVIYLAGRIALKTRAKSGGASARILAVLALLAAMVPLYSAAMHFTSTGPLTLDINRISLQMDGISLLVALTALILGLCVTFFSTKYMQNDEGEEKFFALLMIMIVGIIGLVCATDLFNLWVWFEVMAVSSYLLVAFYRSQPDALEAGVKYLVQSATGSVFILLGIALTFAQTGVLN
ncbi:MAG: proton-conducting transporter membrane subunit, partial [bacterium]